MHESVQVVSYVNVVAFVALALLAVWHWHSRRDRAAAWAAASFLALGFVVLAGRAVGQHPHALGLKALQRLTVAALVVFPYLLFRFTVGFRQPSRRLYAFVSAMTSILVLWTFALPHLPGAGERWPAGFVAFAVVFFVHWVVLSVAAARQLWVAARGQPTVARRRMQMLAFAAASITLALLLTSGAGTTSVRALITQLLAAVSAVAFYLGLAPPAIVRFAWRRPEQERIQAAIQDLVTVATAQEEIAARVLRPAAEIVGATAIALRNDEGRMVGSYGTPPDEPPLELALQGGGTLLVWTSAYAPFFGVDEFAVLRTLGALIGIALDRVRLFEEEHQTRLALERANQVKTNFVALAAHELRTPVTTIHGFVQTLHHLADRLDPDQLVELRQTLEQQTTRMARLVEQLLDLSRLDAEAIEIVPQRLRIRERVLDIVGAAAAGRRDAVDVRIPPELEAEVDPNVLERILSNLITNAFRYGEPPVIVSAHQSDRHLRLAVQDHGPGVEAEFVPDLFERFSRSDGSRAAAAGTGLGLAIARSFAIAHKGDLRYEDAEPHGARFQIVLPSHWT